MAPIGLKTAVSASDKAPRAEFAKIPFAVTFPGLFLTFGVRGVLTAAILGKTFFSTRRPALEAGGQRPTARCALGRKIVWFNAVSDADDGFFPLAPLFAGRGSG